MNRDMQLAEAIRAACDAYLLRKYGMVEVLRNVDIAEVVVSFEESHDCLLQRD